MSTATKPRLVILLAILVLLSATLSSAVQDLVLVQCKNQCKHEIHNKKECEDRCDEKMMMKNEDVDPFCLAICKPFLEDGVGIYRRCMKVCPKTALLERPQAEEGFGNGDTVCDRRCGPYTKPEDYKRRRCMNKCFRSITGKRMENEAICEASCTIIQEKPFTMRCIRVCHERLPGGYPLSS